MFYEPGKTDHGLPHDPFKACVIPRPIGWISTISPTSSGEQPFYNLAPFSQFNNLTFDPPYVMFSSNQTGPFRTSEHPNGSDPTIPNSTKHRSPGFHRKDTVHNAESTGYFCWQLATYPLRHAVNASAEALSYDIDEFEKAGLQKTWSTILPVKIPMVADSPVRFECQYHQTIRLPGNPPFGTVDIVIGRVLGIHINDDYLTDGKIDVTKTLPIARCGYYDYAVIRDSFQMIIPGEKAALGGLEGSTKWNREMAERHHTGQEQQQQQQQQQQEVPAQNRQDIQSHLHRGQSQDQVPVVDNGGKEAGEDAEERWNQ